MTDLLLHNGVIITMDPERRILEGYSVAIRDGCIVAVGPAADLAERFADARRVDCTNKAVLPGMVDLHGYLGGSLLKSVGEHSDGVARRGLAETVLSHYTDEEWWHAEARLSAIERLKMGTTCMFSMMGGNGTRTDDMRYARICAEELTSIGLRTRIGVGPGRPPWPRSYSNWVDGKQIEGPVSFETVIDNCDRLLGELAPGNLVDSCLALSRIGNRNEHDPVWSADREAWVFKQAEAVRELMAKHDVGFWTHAYGNAIEYAYDEKLGLLGPKTILSHCIDISERAIGIMRDTGSSAAHHPRAARVYSYPGRCPIPELMEAGVIVALGSDTPSNHDCDIFLDMKAAVRMQRVHFRDPNLLPPGKTLEMATIDGYRALGLDHELGSIEVGKKADIITVDLFQPHLVPIDMPVYRVVYQATGRDVADVVVDGRLIMQGRKLQTVDEAEVLDTAQGVYRKMVERADLSAHTGVPDHFWGVAR
ncbi:MAG TPA: amidohydrolase family protein [Devosiaceae bacterium]|jgi:cytosine/adenosine deaminase-related metal-dependent hydrolase